MTKIKKTPAAYAAEPGIIKNENLEAHARFPDVYTEHNLGEITAVEEDGDHGINVVSSGQGNLRLEIWEDGTIRFRYTFGRPGRDFSYARDPKAKPAGKAVVKTNKNSFTLVTSKLRVTLNKADGAVKVMDKRGKNLLHECPTGFYCRTTLLRGIDQVRMQFTTDKKEAFYGLGDKAWDTDLQGSSWSNYCEDAFGYPAQRKTLYRAIPFFYGLRDGQAYGIFLDNSYRSHFDFNSTKDGLATFWADGGELDYYFFAGPDINDVARAYHRLTGTPELPPLWAMGFHQCRWSYYPESRVRELAQTFRDKKIPCDAIYLDIDYMDGYRCFTWNKEYFPDPTTMISDLKKDGFHTVVMIDPGIRVDEDYHVYADGVKHDAFCRRGSGEQMVGPVWPPECVWPDYTNPDVRDWWGPLYEGLYNENGVSGFWNDMNEPAVFRVESLTFPDDVRHDFDGAPTDHKKAHNIYGMQMTRASYDGLKDLQPAKRPFLLARASFSGGQRFASLWTGDNIASWEHLKIANRQCIRMAISGFSMVGTDIGGFVDDPSPELLTRWIQLAVFHPLMRIHSMGNNTDGAAEAEAEEVKKAEQINRQDQEPWVHGKEHTKRNRKAIQMRYQLLPYLYSVFQNHVATGTPVLRNLFFYDQTDPLCRKFGDQFMYGEDLLVCPVTEAGIKTMQVYLPKGDWYDFWTGEAHNGSQKLRTKVKADRLPIFVRAGAALPTVDVVQHTGEMQQLTDLELSVFVADQGRSKFYWDAGEGYGHDAGQYTERTYTQQRQGGKLTITQTSTGSFIPSFRRTQVRFVGLTQPPKSISVDGRRITAGIHFGKRAIVINIPFNWEEVVVE